MGYLSGQHGKMQIKNADTSAYSTIGSIKSWSASFQMAVLDTSALADKDRTISHGLRSFNGQATVMYYEESKSNFQFLTRSMIATGGQGYNDDSFGATAAEPEMVKMLLRLDGQGSRDIEFFAYITSFSVTCATGEVVQAEVAFEGHGAPTQFNY